MTPPNWLDGPLDPQACLFGGMDCVWLLKLFWVGRFAKVIQFLSAAVIIIEIIGPERVDAIAVRARETLPAPTIRGVVRRTQTTVRATFERLSAYRARKRPSSGGASRFGLVIEYIGVMVALSLSFFLVALAIVLFGELLVALGVTVHWTLGLLLSFIGVAAVFTVGFYLAVYGLAISLSLLLLLPRALMAGATGVALFLLRRKRMSELALYASFFLAFMGLLLDLLVS